MGRSLRVLAATGCGPTSWSSSTEGCGIGVGDPVVRRRTETVRVMRHYTEACSQLEPDRTNQRMSVGCPRYFPPRLGFVGDQPATYRQLRHSRPEPVPYS